MCQPKPRAFTFWLQINFHPTRSFRHAIAAPFEAPGEHHARVSYDLDIFARNYVSAIWIEAINSAGSRVDFGANSHPAKHFCRVGKKLEDYRRWRLNVDFLDDGIRGQAFSSPPPLPPTSAWQLGQPLILECFEKTPQLCKSLWTDAIKPPRAIPPFSQQSGLDEHSLDERSQMLRDSGPRNSKMPGNRSRAQFP